MSTKIRPRTLAVLVALIGLLGVAAVTVPSSGAAEPTVVRLNLGSDGRYFKYGDEPAQNLASVTNGCEMTNASVGGPVMALTSTPTGGKTRSAPGLGPDAIGVKQSASSGNGTPCNQVESAETLTLKPGTALNGKLFKGVRLDLEMTGNAIVKLTFSGGATPSPVTYTLQTGINISVDQKAPPVGLETDYDTTAPYLVSSVGTETLDACAAPSSSGPNSGDSDNCQWTVMPVNSFNTMTMTTTTGSVSLEGGGDFAAGSDNDTLFYIANSGPTAVNDSYTTPEDTDLSGDVTDNDTDPNGDTLTGATTTIAPTHGVLNLASDGTFTYNPDDNYNGPDSFTYTVSDGSVTSNPASVSIAVTAVNDPPSATENGINIEEDSTGTVDVADDVDVGDTLTTDCDEPAGWTATDLGGGNVKITPPADFVGELTIDCTVTDSHGATTESPVTIAVGVTNANDAPVAVDDEGDFNPDAGPTVAINVLANDTDIDSGDTLVVENLTYPDGGSATVNGGIVTFTPPVGITAPVTFNYQAFDGTEYSNVATVTVYPIICSEDEVTDTAGDLTGTFTRLSDPFECKRFSLIASLDDDGSILFQPSGLQTGVKYRGVLSLGYNAPDPVSGALKLRLRYDPDGGTLYKPMLWCIDPVFDGDQLVTGATLPTGESWCVASAYSRDLRDDNNSSVETIWQIYGVDDPRLPIR